MTAHAKQHSMVAAADHAAGTNDTLVGTVGGVPAEVAFNKAAAAANTIAQRDANGDVIVPVVPTANAGAASKSYVDGLVNGKAYKDPCRVATTGNIADLAAGAPDTVDGVLLVAGNRVLVKAQTLKQEEGIYVVDTLGTGANGAWSRAADLDSAAEAASATCRIQEGTAAADKEFNQTSEIVTLGVTPMLWVESGSGSFAAAPNGGLQLIGNEFSIKPDGTTGGNSANVVKTSANGTAIGVDNATIVESGGNLQVAANSIGVGQLASQKPVITAAGNVPVDADVSASLTAEGDWCFVKAADNSLWLAFALNAGGIKRGAVEAGLLV